MPCLHQLLLHAGGSARPLLQIYKQLLLLLPQQWQQQWRLPDNLAMPPPVCLPQQQQQQQQLSALQLLQQMQLLDDAGEAGVGWSGAGALQVLGLDNTQFDAQLLDAQLGEQEDDCPGHGSSCQRVVMSSQQQQQQQSSADVVAAGDHRLLSTQADAQAADAGKHGVASAALQHVPAVHKHQSCIHNNTRRVVDDAVGDATAMNELNVCMIDAAEPKTASQGTALAAEQEPVTQPQQQQQPDHQQEQQQQHMAAPAGPKCVPRFARRQQRYQQLAGGIQQQQQQQQEEASAAAAAGGQQSDDDIVVDDEAEALQRLSASVAGATANALPRVVPVLGRRRTSSSAAGAATAAGHASKGSLPLLLSRASRGGMGSSSQAADLNLRQQGFSGAARVEGAESEEEIESSDSGDDVTANEDDEWQPAAADVAAADEDAAAAAAAGGSGCAGGAAGRVVPVIGRCGLVWHCWS
jgi:hypothetical protein